MRVAPDLNLHKISLVSAHDGRGMPRRHLSEADREDRACLAQALNIAPR